MRRWLPILVLAAALQAGCVTDAPRSGTPEAKALPDPALSNAWRVDEYLIRCAQPDAAGMRALEAAGVTTSSPAELVVSMSALNFLVRRGDSTHLRYAL